MRATFLFVTNVLFLLSVPITAPIWVACVCYANGLKGFTTHSGWVGLFEDIRDALS